MDKNGILGEQSNKKIKRCTVATAVGWACRGHVHSALLAGNQNPNFDLGVITCYHLSYEFLQTVSPGQVLGASVLPFET